MDNEGPGMNQQMQSNLAVSMELEVTDNGSPYSAVGELNEEERDDQSTEEEEEEEEADEQFVELFLERPRDRSGRLFPPSCSNAPTPPSTPQRAATPRPSQRSSANPNGSRGNTVASTTTGVMGPAPNISPLALAPNGLRASQTNRYPMSDGNDTPPTLVIISLPRDLQAEEPIRHGIIEIEIDAEEVVPSSPTLHRTS